MNELWGWARIFPDSLRRVPIVLASLVVLLFAIDPGAGRAAAEQPGEPVQTDIVLQIGHKAPVEAVVWLNGGENLASLDREGWILVWEVASRSIVNRVRLPLDWSRDGLLGCAKLKDFSFDEPSGVISIEYAVGPYDPNAKLNCPSSHKFAGYRFTYSLDAQSLSMLSSKTTKPAGGMAILPEPAPADRSAEEAVSSIAMRQTGGRVHLADPGQETDSTGMQPDASSEQPASPNLKFFPLSPDGTRRALPTKQYEGPPGEYDPYALKYESFYDDAGCIDRDGCPPDDVRVPWGLTFGLPGEEANPEDDLTGNFTSNLLDAEISLDGGRLALIRQKDPHPTLEREFTAGDGPDSREIGLIDLTSGKEFRPVGLYTFRNGGLFASKNAYPTPQLDRVHWVGSQSIALTSGQDFSAAYRKLDDSVPEAGTFRLPREIFRFLPCSTDDYLACEKMDELENATGDLVISSDCSPASGCTRHYTDRDADSDDRGNDGADREEAVEFVFPTTNDVAAGNDRYFLFDIGYLVEAGTGRQLAKVESDSPLIGAGYIARSNLLWVASNDGVIRFLDPADGRKLFSLYLLGSNQFFLLMPDGRYDANIVPDSDFMRWVVPDNPWHALPPQTFMRDYYEPGLYRKLLDCLAARDCAQVLKPLPPIANLNRVLPKVEITGVTQGKDVGEAVVSVKISEGFDPDATNGKTTSGIDNPQIFLNSYLVGFTPAEHRKLLAALESWRSKGAQDKEPFKYDFTIPVPTNSLPAVLISAAAFNDDRVRSEVANFGYTLPNRHTRKLRQPKVYLINIGIDDYDMARFRLNYAVNDARLMASKLNHTLSATPNSEVEVHQLTLAGERRTDGTRVRVDRDAVLDALRLVMSDEDRESHLHELRVRGIDASQLAEATPDDMVIITYSGHGWADQRGNFYLIPSNGLWEGGKEAPNLDTLVSSTELADILQGISADQIVLILDACNSAASVDSQGFKPGPLGDKGLGQLAYDKGILVLAATQANDLAFEDKDLQHGLLTFALAKSLDDINNGTFVSDIRGSVTISEWLNDGIDRLPTLIQDVRKGKYRGVTFVNRDPATVQRRIQKPVLFDFTPFSAVIGGYAN